MEWFLPVTLAALLAGVLGFAVVTDLPQAEVIPAALVLASMVGIAWWNWWNAETGPVRENDLSACSETIPPAFADAFVDVRNNLKDITDFTVVIRSKDLQQPSLRFQPGSRIFS